ncbi:tetratricopeptide repeat-containing sensor histidine kinase [Pseudotenacibaculum sp. MALMAid0570]|uniref:tetratricopeptide repeat-containing sensor histidine kinase n=1 Tax=Pseudotenacibaculum sp. MALMAid0570 TaxID=3143938 RepID=UPI0032DFBD13
MLRKIVIIIFCLYPLISPAQKKQKLSSFFKAVELRSSDLISTENLRQARIYFLQKVWDSTLIYASKYINANELNKRNNDYAYFFKAYSLRKKKLFEQSKKEFHKISETFDFYDKLSVYMGGIALEQRRFTRAIYHFERALKNIQSEAMIGVKVATLENNIGLCYLHLEQYDLADKYLLRIIKKLEAAKDTLKLIGTYGNIATMYYDQNLDEKAIPYFKAAYDLSKYVHDFDLRRKTAKNMSIVEENKKNYIKALLYRKEYEQWKDSLNDQNRIYETAQLEKKIAVKQKQNEVDRLEADNKVKAAQNKVFLYSGALLFVLLIIVFTSYKGKVKRNKIITAQKEDLDALNATKDKLFSIVSHDLRSSVNAIKRSNAKLLGNLDTQNKNEITQNLQQNSSIVNAAYGLLDNLLNWALMQTKQSYFEMTELSLFRITEHVAYNYQPILQEKKIAYTNSISRKTEIFADQETIKIILRNLLDNAIKFTKENGSIHLYTEEKEETYVTLIIEDSGIGMDNATQKELLKNTQLLSKKKHEDTIGTGLGLHLVKSMIAKNEGKFNIESEVGKGTKISISFLKQKPNGAS